MGKTGPPPKNNKKKRRFNKIIACDIIAYIGAVVVFGFSIMILTTDTGQWQPYSVVSFPKPYNENRTLEADINLYSPTFGAGSNITVHVIITPDEQSLKEFNENGRRFATDNSGKGLPQRYYMMFEGSTCEPIPTTFEERYKRSRGCALPLEFWDNKNYYRNFTSILYPIEGEYGVLLDEVMPERSSTDIIGDRFIQIAPLETRINYMNAEYISIASLVAIYVAGVSLYLQFRKIWTRSSTAKES